MTVGIILYGGPASGKDTVTKAMTELAPRVQLFPVLKAGPGKTEGYRMTTVEDIDARGDLLWRVERYEATYAVARSDVRAATTSNDLPVIHVGSPEQVQALTNADLGDWLAVELWCPLPVATERLYARNPDDLSARLEVWRSTPRLPLDLSIDTSATDPSEAARIILTAR